MQVLSDENKDRLIDWLLKQRHFGNVITEITKEQIDQAKKSSTLHVIERTNRLLKYYAFKLDRTGSKLHWEKLVFDAN